MSIPIGVMNEIREVGHTAYLDKIKKVQSKESSSNDEKELPID